VRQHRRSGQPQQFGR
jgi:hypothetical protein